MSCNIKRNFARRESFPQCTKCSTDAAIKCCRGFLVAYYERAQDRPVIDCRLAELIEQLSKSLEEKDLQQE
jgi:hypothetical protein